TNSTLGKQGGGIVQGDASHLHEKDALQIIGYGDLGGGTFVATRVFVFEPPGAPQSPGPEATLPSRGPTTASQRALCHHYWYGITSWFDCSIGACGAPCPRCNSNYNQMAWPRLEYCGGGGVCNADCGGNT